MAALPHESGWGGDMPRRSDRAELTALAFQFCFPQEVMGYAPDTEGGLSFMGTIVVKLRWRKNRR